MMQQQQHEDEEASGHSGMLGKALPPTAAIKDTNALGRAPTHGCPQDPPPPTKRMARQLAKTQVCKHFMRGYCRYEGKCAYAHNTDELVPRPNLLKTKMCINFLSGMCKKEDCTYAHGLAELRLGNPGRRGHGSMNCDEASSELSAFSAPSALGEHKRGNSNSRPAPSVGDSSLFRGVPPSSVGDSSLFRRVPFSGDAAPGRRGPGSFCGASSVVSSPPASAVSAPLVTSEPPEAFAGNSLQQALSAREGQLLGRARARPPPGLQEEQPPLAAEKMAMALGHHLPAWSTPEQEPFQRARPSRSRPISEVEQAQDFAPPGQLTAEQVAEILEREAGEWRQGIRHERGMRPQRRMPPAQAFTQTQQLPVAPPGLAAEGPMNAGYDFNGGAQPEGSMNGGYEFNGGAQPVDMVMQVQEAVYKAAQQAAQQVLQDVMPMLRASEQSQAKQATQQMLQAVTPRYQTAPDAGALSTPLSGAMSL